MKLDSMRTRIAVIALLLAWVLLFLAGAMRMPVLGNLSLLVWPFFGVLAGYIAVVRRSSAVLVVASFFWSLFLIETGAALYELSPWGRDHAYKYLTSGKFRASDPLLRSRLIPFSIVSESKVYDEDDFAYRDVTYIIDEKSRRATADTDPPSGEAAQHILFLGCSFTFGMGVQQDETLPSRFQALAGQRFKAYNYGEGGYGPSQTLLLLQPDSLFDDVRPKTGIAVFSFIEDHLNRCTPHVLNKFLGSFASSPLYRLDEHGALIGPYKLDDDPKLVRIAYVYETVHKMSPLFRLLDKRLEFSYVATKDAYRVAAEILVAARREYQRHFDGEFHVLIWPRVTKSDKHLCAFMAQLNAHGIKTIRIPEYPDANLARIHPFDPHPSAEEYNWVAQHLNEYLNNTK